MHGSGFGGSTGAASPEAPERPLVAGPFRRQLAPHPRRYPDRAPLPSLEWALAQEPWTAGPAGAGPPPAFTRETCLRSLTLEPPGLLFSAKGVSPLAGRPAQKTDW